MIRQIEEISQQNKPKIEVIHLKYISNISLGQFLPQFYNDIIRTVPGYARLFPMTTPNAIMLVGWGDMMDTAKELVAELDKPMATENSLRHVFKLKHISAQNAATFLRTAFPPIVPAYSGFLYRVTFFTETRSNTLVVQAAPNDLEEVKRMINEIDVANGGIKSRVERIKLNHTLASDLSTTLRNVIASGNAGGMNASLELLIQGKEGKQLIESGILSNVTIEPDVRTNGIMITAPESCMAFIRELVALMDKSSPEASVKIFQIINGDANSIQSMLTSLFPTVAEGTPGPQLPGAANEESLIPIRFAVDVRTNCLIVAGAPGDLEIIEAMLYEIDREDRLARKNEVYFLKNMKADAVAMTIQTYITSKLTVQEASVTTGVMSAFGQLESAAVVVADTESNSLIISATEKYYDEIMRLIKEIDKSPPQVVIKVLIAEVTLSEDKEWAAELGLQDPLMFSKRGGNLLFNGGNGSNSLGDGVGAPGTVGSQLLSNFDAGRTGRAGYGGLVLNASSDYLNIMLRALHEKNRLEVLSSPQITTMNNTRARITVGQEISRMRLVTNQNGTTEQIPEDKDVSLDVMIVPTISPEGTIVMMVVLQKNKLGAVVAGSQTFDTASLQTMVCAADNQTVVLGGLLTKEESKLRRKIPLLGDIPVLGKMFRHEMDQTTRKELLIILTPRIVKEQDELEQIKQMEMARMSWCLSNVTQVYGDVGAYNVISERPYTGNAPVIMPGPVKPESLQTIETPFIAPTLPKRN
jgi:type II secretion system protein D